MNLHDLMFVFGLFMLDSVTDILNLINLQPTKKLFFRSYMEMDNSNLIQILSFESRFVRALLKDVLEKKNYNSDYPLFYKM